MLYHCEGGDVSEVTNKTDCLNKGPPYRWVNRKYNFDNLGQVENKFICIRPRRRPKNQSDPYFCRHRSHIVNVILQINYYYYIY